MSNPNGPQFLTVPDRLNGLLDRRDELASRTISTGISYLDDCMLGLHPTDLMVLSAATGAGKTTSGLFMASQAAANGLRSHFMALEAFQGEIEARLLYRELCALLSKAGKWTPDLAFNRWMHGKCSGIATFEEKAKTNLANLLKGMHTLYRANNFTHQHITKQFLAVRGKTDLIVLDHLHYIDLDGPSENVELKKVIKAVRDSALDMEVPVIVIAHLRKKQGGRGARVLPEIDDIHGSSDIAKAATKIVMLAPCPAVPFGEKGSNRRVAQTAIQVLKDRYAGATNYVGLVGFDMPHMSYKPTYGVARINSAGNTLMHLAHKELPSWARPGSVGFKAQLGDETSLG